MFTILPSTSCLFYERNYNFRSQVYFRTMATHSPNTFKKKKEDVLKEFERIDFFKIYFDQLQKIYITVLNWQMMK